MNRLSHRTVIIRRGRNHAYLLFLLGVLSVWPSCTYAGCDSTGKVTKSDSVLTTLVEAAWQPFNQRHGLHSNYILTGMYFDAEFAWKIAKELISISSEFKIKWHQADLINMPNHCYFWQGVSPTSPIKKTSIRSSPQNYLRKTVLPSPGKNDQALIYIRSVHDTLPSIIMFNSKYYGWPWEKQKRRFTFILAFAAKSGGFEIQYQVLEGSPDFWTQMDRSMDLSTHYFPAGFHVPYVYNPLSFPVPEPRKIVRMQTQPQRDSLYQWVVAGDHQVVTEDLHSVLRQTLNLPEILYREPTQVREQRLQAGLDFQRWQVISAYYRTRPYWMGAEYYFTLQSRKNPSMRYSAVFSLLHPPEPDQFNSEQVVLKTFRRVSD